MPNQGYVYYLVTVMGNYTYAEQFIFNYIDLQHVAKFCFKLKRKNNNAHQLMFHTEIQ